MRDGRRDPNSPPAASSEYDRELTQGALVNALGVAAKALLPALYVVLTRLFGPARMGVYFLVTTAGEMAASVLSIGVLDAMVVFGSRRVAARASDIDAEGPLYAVVGGAFALTVGSSSVLAVVCVALAEPLATAIYPASRELPAAVRFFALSMPFLAFASTAVSAIKIRMRMEYDVAIMSVGRPLVLLVLSVAVARFGGGVTALMVATLVSHGVAAVAAGIAFAAHFDAGRAVRAAAHPRLDRGFLEFSIAQGTSATIKRYLPRIGVLPLAASGHSAASLALYSTGALIASSVREVEVAIGNALAPVVARYRASDDRAALQATLGRATSMALTVTVPVLLGVLIFRDDVLALVHSSYRGETGFLVLLASPALVAALLGLPACFVFSTGHHRAVAVNAAAVLSLNALLSAVLVPESGLWGAALAAALSGASITVVEACELFALERLRPSFRSLLRHGGERAPQHPHS